MPYDPNTDNYFWGKSFARDGSDYDPSAKRPKLSDAYRVLKGKATLFNIVITGKIYKSKSNIGGVPGIVDIESIKAVLEISKMGGAAKHGGGGVALEEKLQVLMGLAERPTKITGIYFRPQD